MCNHNHGMNTQNRTTRESRDPIYFLKQEMKIARLSPQTIKSYLRFVEECLRFSQKDPRSINSNDIKDYLEYLADKSLSASSLNITYSALRFYFERILHRKFFVSIPRAKKEKKLPVVLTKEEILSITKSINHVTHKLIIAMIYGSGLRLSEVINIKVKDLNLKNNILILRSAKGKKDRQTIISKMVANVLIDYIKYKNANDYLFSTNRNGKYTKRSIQQIFYQALADSGIKKQASIHSLRHSFATHLVEADCNLRYIQELLGHKSVATTQIYTKVAVNRLEDVASPLD